VNAHIAHGKWRQAKCVVKVTSVTYRQQARRLARKAGGRLPTTPRTRTQVVAHQQLTTVVDLYRLTYFEVLASRRTLDHIEYEALVRAGDPRRLALGRKARLVRQVQLSQGLLLR